jgi:hypothetical protein
MIRMAKQTRLNTEEIIVRAVEFIIEWKKKLVIFGKSCYLIRPNKQKTECAKGRTRGLP